MKNISAQSLARIFHIPHEKPADCSGGLRPPIPLPHAGGGGRRPPLQQECEICGLVAAPSASKSKLTTENRLLTTSSAFTLIELLVVIAIIMVLAGLVSGVARYAFRTAKTSRAKAEIATFEMALENLKADQGFYPRSTNTTDSSAVLYANLAAKTKKYMTFSSKQLRVVSGVTNIYDPFGGVYYYYCPGKTNTATFDLWSRGADGSNSTDDVTNWSH